MMQTIFRRPDEERPRPKMVPPDNFSLLLGKSQPFYSALFFFSSLIHIYIFVSPPQWKGEWRRELHAQ